MDDCYYYEIVAKLEWVQTGETKSGEPIGYPQEVPDYEYCHLKQDYPNCADCKDKK